MVIVFQRDSVTASDSGHFSGLTRSMQDRTWSWSPSNSEQSSGGNTCTRQSPVAWHKSQLDQTDRVGWHTRHTPYAALFSFSGI